MDMIRSGITLLGLGLVVGCARWQLRQQRRQDFLGEVVLITGGSRGLGLEIARRLADEGARLALLARDETELRRAAEELRRRGADVHYERCDIRDPDEVRDAVRNVRREMGPVDVLMNAAGVITTGPIEHMEREDFEQSMDVHFWGPLYLIEQVAPHMMERARGRIVNVSSIGGLVAIPHVTPYCASKFALTGLSDGLRAELAKDNIRVTTVCPGLMRTGSHLQAQFKGQHRTEYAWFAIGNNFPLASVSSGYAAQRIIEACRHGDPSLVIGLPAKLLHWVNALMPGVFAAATAAVARLLPKPNGRAGDERRLGRESASHLTPAWLTRLSDEAAMRNNEADFDLRRANMRVERF
ncbi:MAG: SDR family NAD(P)-dependent oxidoreductase [Phycisphaeraceae bacterium]